MHLAMAGRKEGRKEGREINRVVKRIRFPSPSTSSAFVRPRPVTSTREGNGGILCHSMTRGDCVGEMYSERTQSTVDIERHRKLEFRARVLQHSGIILDQHIL